MKIMFLIRHAKSSWENEQIKDHERKLNKRGLRDASIMGEKLNTLHPAPEKILCSTAIRAKETVEFIKEKWFPLKKVDYTRQLYEGPTSVILNSIQSIPSSINSIALFFHNPMITHLANLLDSNSIINIPTCGVVIMTSEKKDWQSIEVGSGKLVGFEYPKKFVNH